MTIKEDAFIDKSLKLNIQNAFVYILAKKAV